MIPSLHALLLTFCSTDRAALRAPFTKDNWSYATNGRILVRIPKIDTPDAHESPPNAENLYGMHNWGSPEDYQPLPELPTWPNSVVCGSCDGDGTTYCKECGNSAPCNDCNTTGVKRPYFMPWLIGNQEFDLFYLHKLANLPGVKVRAENGAMTFYFDGSGEGILMGMRIKKEDFHTADYNAHLDFMLSKNEITQETADACKAQLLAILAKFEA